MIFYIVSFIFGFMFGFTYKHYANKKFLTENLSRTERYVVERMIAKKNANKKKRIH